MLLNIILKKISLDEVYDIFSCKKQSLFRWVNRYKKDKSIKRYSRKPVSYKITNEQVKYALTLLKQNEQITMFELAKLVKQKIQTFWYNTSTFRSSYKR